MKKALHVISLLFASLTLSGCSMITDIISNIIDPSTSSSTSIISYSEPEDGSYSRVASKYTYEDFIECNYYNLDSCPTTGNPKLLVIPVWFTDSSNYITNKDNVRSDIEKAYFGTSEETGWHSVSSYYEADSFGAVKLTGVVSKWYECGYSSSKFYTDEDGITSSLVNTAVKWYKTANGLSNLRDFDTDGNGYIDGVMLIYGAPDYRSSSTNYSNMWAYCYWVQDTSVRSKSNPGANVFFWASYDFMYSSMKALVRTGKSNYGGGDTSYCTIDAHTYIHEMGHVFGLEDYYDYSDEETCPAGGFSMQDYNVGAHDPFSRLSLGWITPIVVNKSTTITVNPIENSGDVILLSPNYDGSPFDEYILLELYTPTGLNEFDSKHAYSGNYPKGPSKAGVRVWHIDARLYSAATRKVTNNPTVGYVTGATSNTPSGDYSVDYAGSTDYKLNYLVRNSTFETYNTQNIISASDLFTTGDAFSMTSYRKQFPNSGLLDSKKSLGWTVSFDSVSSSSMTVTCTQA